MTQWRACLCLMANDFPKGIKARAGYGQLSRIVKSDPSSISTFVRGRGGGTRVPTTVSRRHQGRRLLGLSQQKSLSSWNHSCYGLFNHVLLVLVVRRVIIDVLEPSEYAADQISRRAPRTRQLALILCSNVVVAC